MTLVPSASLVVIASVFIDIIIARGGVEALGRILTLQAEPEMYLMLADGLTAGYELWLAKPASSVCIRAFVDLRRYARWAEECLRRPGSALTH